MWRAVGGLRCDVVCGVWCNVMWRMACVAAGLRSFAPSSMEQRSLLASEYTLQIRGLPKVRLLIELGADRTAINMRLVLLLLTFVYVYVFAQQLDVMKFARFIGLHYGPVARSVLCCVVLCRCWSCAL